MPSAHIVRTTTFEHTPRCKQLEGIFDVDLPQEIRHEWDVKLDLPTDWNIGLILGPSGIGKSVIAHELFGDCIRTRFKYSSGQSVVDSFPKHLGISDIVELLSCVGFSSPPDWLKPYHVLSTGQKFRVDVARLLAELPELAVMDEFTSVVDRNVAQIASYAVQKAVRRRGQRFIAVSCHYDILEWLQADWVYEPHTGTFTRGSLWHRPELACEVKRVHSSAWKLFAPHHYLSAALNKSAVCFVLFWEQIPVTFSAWLAHRGRITANKQARREHRTVTLPDYQGVGFGNILSNLLASMYKALDYRVFSTTTHPAFARARQKGGQWKVTRALSTRDINKEFQQKRSLNRLTYRCKYIGESMNRQEAELLFNG